MALTSDTKSPEGLVAVIVGIDGYDVDKADIPPLRCAVNDAVSLSEALKKIWLWYELNASSLLSLKKKGLPVCIFDKLKSSVKDRKFPSLQALSEQLGRLLAEVDAAPQLDHGLPVLGQDRRLPFTDFPGVVGTAGQHQGQTC